MNLSRKDQKQRMLILRITNRKAIPRVDVEAHPLDDKFSSVVPTVWDREEITMCSHIIRLLNLGPVTTADHNSERDVLIVKRSRSRSRGFRLELNNTSETMSCSRGFPQRKRMCDNRICSRWPTRRIVGLCGGLLALPVEC